MRSILKPVDSFAPVRIGVLGCSDIAARKLIPALTTSSVAKLAAVSSRSAEKAGSFAGTADCLRLSHEGLLESRDLDLVYISLPNHLHEEWTIRALESGKHVICEKPLSTSAQSVERMVAAAERNGRLLYENLMFLHHPQHGIVKDLINGGAIGRIVALRSCFGFPLPESGNFRLDPEQGGGAFQDLARYPLGTALFFLGTAPGSFSGHALYRESLNTALWGTAIIGNGVRFSFSMAFGQQYESYYELIGETGKIRLDRAYTTPADLVSRIQLVQGGVASEISVPPHDHFQLMIRQVCSVVKLGGDYAESNNRSRQLACLAEEMVKGCLPYEI